MITLKPFVRCTDFNYNCGSPGIFWPLAWWRKGMRRRIVTVWPAKEWL